MPTYYACAFAAYKPGGNQFAMLCSIKSLSQSRVYDRLQIVQLHLSVLHLPNVKKEKDSYTQKTNSLRLNMSAMYLISPSIF